MGANLSGVTDLLARLVAESERETRRRRDHVSVDELEARAARYTPKDFRAALRAERLAVIAEMKRRTPSMGVLDPDYRPEQIARAYVEGGAAALSVLTQEGSFGGEIEHLDAVRAHVELPILRKDFIVDRYQVLEARAHGADGVLLIVGALGVRLLEMLAAVREQGLAALVEVHDEPETRVAVEAGAEVIGINHRDLRTFEVDLGLTARLRHLIPDDRLVVAESGIRGVADARRLREAGADAILVGELLMRSADPAGCIRDLATA
jgi:indole-3-glycerol phosphate synthase